MELVLGLIWLLILIFVLRCLGQISRATAEQVKILRKMAKDADSNTARLDASLREMNSYMQQEFQDRQQAKVRQFQERTGD